MAKSIGLSIIEFSSLFERLKPRFVMLIGDRYEALAAAIAAAYTNQCIIHLQGGEISGSIDESARHAITKLSHYHFPATKRACQNIINMGESSDCVFNFGCPVGDEIRSCQYKLTNDCINSMGVGHEIDVSKPYLLVVLHYYNRYICLYF